MTGDVLAKLLSTFRTDSLRNVRDRAILMVAFASGGRRRSEIAGLRKEQLTVEPPIPLDGNSGRLGPFRTTLSEVMCTIYLYAQCSGGINAVKANSEVPMPQTSYKISEARKKFAEVLERANQGEEIVIMRGNEVYARIGPATGGGKRPFGLLRHRGLPSDLFDTTDAEQAAIDAGDWIDDTGVWQGKSNSNKSTQ